MVKSGAQKARARDTGSKLKFFERAAKEEEEKKEDARTRPEQVKEDEEDDDQVECREARVFDGRKRACGKKGDTKEAGKTPTGCVNQKISRHASCFITSEGEEEGQSVKGLVGGPPVANCVAGACAFCIPD